MKAEGVLKKFWDKGVAICLSPDGQHLDIEPFSLLNEKERHYIKCYKTELLWMFKHPNGYPENILTTDTCPDCGVTMTSDNGEFYERLICPAGCPEPYPRFIRRRNAPRLTADGDLIIPFTAPARYLHWKGGDTQSIWATLAELNAPLSTWRKYAYERSEMLDGTHEARCRTQSAQGEGFVYCDECGWYAVTASRALSATGD